MGRRSKKEQMRLDIEALIEHLNTVLSKVEVTDELFERIPKVAAKVVERSRLLGRRKTDLSDGEEISALILEEVFEQGYTSGIKHCTSCLSKAIKKADLKEDPDATKLKIK